MLVDGVYRVIFSNSVNYGNAEEIVCFAYNNRLSFDLVNRAYRDVSGYDYNYADFLRTSYNRVSLPYDYSLSSYKSAIDGVSDLHNYLLYGFGISANTIYDVVPASAYRGTGLGSIDTDADKWSYDGECLFGFINPGGSGTITKITICALILGTGKTKFRTPGGATTYGTETSKETLYQWIYTDYESAWSWSDIDNIKAGVWLECDNGKCRAIKLRVTCSDGSTTDIYPSSTYSSSYIRRTFACPFLNPEQTALYYDAQILSKMYPNRSIASDLSEFPPSGSLINSIKVSFSFCGRDGMYLTCIYTQNHALLEEWFTGKDPGVLIKPFLYLDGNYYYGTERAIGDEFNRLTTYEQIWSTNPATGLDWTYHEAQGAIFGVAVTSSDEDMRATVRIYRLSATINFCRPIQSNPTLQLLGADDDTVSLTQYFQNPIRADDLIFHLPDAQWLAEREELALIRDGVIVWRGISWTVEENNNHTEVIVHAKSQQMILDYRVFPGLKYVPTNKEFTSFYNINDILSNDAPRYPAWSYIRGDEDHPKGNDISWPVHPWDIFSMRIGTHNYICGLFFFLNSYFWDSYRAISDLSNKMIFSIETTPQHEDTDTWSIEGCTSMCGGYDIYCPPPFSVVSPNEAKGGLFRLAWRSNPANVVRGEFSISGDTLYTQSPPHSTFILCDQLVDTHIRPGTNDLGSMHLLVDLDIEGTAATWFSEFFQNMGQEIRYRYEWDGLVYQDAAVEIANGSENSPLVAFVDGMDNCHITKRVPSDLAPIGVIGTGTNPKIATAWATDTPWLEEVMTPPFVGEELEAYLERQLDAEDTTYEIEVLSEYWHLRPGDYISVDVAGDGPKAVRIQQINSSRNGTTIIAGRKLKGLNEQFGKWRLQGMASDRRSKIRTDAIDMSETLVASKTFAVLASDLVLPGWQCKAAISWDFVMKWVLYGAGKNEADYDTLLSSTSPYPANAFIQIWGDTYDEYGSHEYEFYITRNMTVHGIEPYGTNDVEVLTTGRFKWRKDGGAWSAEMDGFDIWHETTDYVDLGNGLKGRVIFTYPISQPQVTPVTTNILNKTGYAWACATIDLSEYNKFVILKLDGKVIPPCRYAAVDSSGSIDVDITEFCNVAGSHTLTAQLYNGLSKSASPQYYHTVAGSIQQSRYAVPLEAE